MSRPRRVVRTRGRFNKKVRVRRKNFGLWWEAYGLARKIISLARQTELNIKKGDTVSKFIEAEGKLVTIVVKGVFTYGNPPEKVYTFDLGEEEIITPAKGWERTEIRIFDLQTVLKDRPNVRWKGEWRVQESSLKYPITPYPRVT